MSMSADHRSTNVPMYEPGLVPCQRCGVKRAWRYNNHTELCASCTSVKRARINVTEAELALTGGTWVNRHGVQRWVAA